MLGEFALLRTAGLPVRLWLAAGAPELFALLRRLDRVQDLYAEVAAGLAERIGAGLVNQPGLSDDERRRALAARRALHNATVLRPAERDHLAHLIRRCGNDSRLLGDLRDAAALATRSAAMTDQAAAAVAAEQRRLLPLPWHLLEGSPVGQLGLRDGAIPPAGDIRDRLARGEAWTTKRMRRRSAYLWRMIARGAVKTTPRTWLGHLALAGVDGSAAGPLTVPALTARYATETVDNVHLPRRELALSGELGPDTRIAIAPLRVDAGDRITLWAGDPADPGELREITVRRTWLLDAVDAVLAGGVRTVAEVEALILPDGAGQRERTVLRGFLGRLATMGVLQVSTPPVKRCDGWHRLVGPRQGGAAPAAPAGGGGRTAVTTRPAAGDEPFVDVYRAVTGTIPGGALRTLQESVEQALRLHELIRLDRPAGAGNVLRRLGDGPRPVLDLLAERLAEVAREQAAPPPPATGGGTADDGAARGGHQHVATAWTEPAGAGSGYHRLLGLIDERAARGPDGAVPVEVSAALLDAVGAPRVGLTWPLDCIVRPIGSGAASVLDVVLPAGLLDARFAEALATLHGPLAHVTAYRRFLSRLDELTGVTSVELLIPPLQHRAANAVRRPGYTRLWTGDADLSGYCPEWPDGPQRFVPLPDLTVRRSGAAVVVETSAGEPLRILYHSMRVAPWPWSLLVNLLTHGSPQQVWNRQRLRSPLVALPHRDYLPRLTASPALVLSPAQWRLRRIELWDAGAADLAKVRHLVRLRGRLGLPRWVMVYADAGKPFPCDLESLNAVAVLERALGPTGAAEVFLEEMLPAPDRMPARDLACRPGDRSAAEVMFRLPCQTTGAELASRAAAAIAAATRGTTAPAVGPHAAAPAAAQSPERTFA